MRYPVLVVLVCGLWLLTGCGGEAASPSAGRACGPGLPCALGQVCVEGWCQSAGPGGDAWAADGVALGDTWAAPDAPLSSETSPVPDFVNNRDLGQEPGPDLIGPLDQGGGPDLFVSVDTGGPPTGCGAIGDCADGEICDLALGRCEPRFDMPSLGLAVTSFHPLAGAAGDVIVVDGSGFYTGMLGSLSVRLGVGSASMGGLASLWADENRVLATLPGGAQGTVSITSEAGASANAPGLFGTTTSGLLACDGSSLAARGLPGERPDALGPYAAGYVDWPRQDARIYYPARCGSVRRPPVPGTWPLVFILHGNGAIHVSYEYLAQLLASWGFVSVMPLTVNNNQYDPEVVTRIAGLVDQVRGQELSGIHGVLAGVTTTSEIAFVGHSRGCGRMQDVYDDKRTIHQAAVASIFLGPHDVNYVVPGLFLMIAGTEDGQSYPAIYNQSYARQSAPRWKVVIEGGNHSLFTDHKVYHMMDGSPRVSRREQLRTVVSFALPLLQRAFGLDEPFADQLDAPPSSPLYTVTYEP